MIPCKLTVSYNTQDAGSLPSRRTRRVITITQGHQQTMQGHHHQPSTINQSHKHVPSSTYHARTRRASRTDTQDTQGRAGHAGMRRLSPSRRTSNTPRRATSISHKNTRYSPASTSSPLLYLHIPVASHSLSSSLFSFKLLLIM